ncbi:hypothetical protein V8F33_013452 [Rhypophila sp. PSN 637]
MRCCSDTNLSTNSPIITLDSRLSGLRPSTASQLNSIYYLNITTITPYTMSGTVRPPASAREQTLSHSLSTYKVHISTRNKRSLTVYINLLTTILPPPGSGYAIDVVGCIRVQRLHSLWRLLGIPTNTAFPTFPSQKNLIAQYVPLAVTATDAQLNLLRETPEDILRYYDYLAQLAPLGVDGVIRGVFRTRMLYNSTGMGDILGRKNKLKENCIIDVRERISAPEEFKLLGEWLLVDGLGLGFWKERKGGFRVWYRLAQCVPESQVSDLDQGANYGFVMGQLVKDARNGDLARFAQVDEGKWTVGGGFEMGGGDGARICAVYAKSEALWWGWRYFVVETDNEGPSRKWEFRNVPELLGWAKSYREEKFLVGEAAIRASVSDRNVWEGKWEGDEEEVEDDDA